MTSSTIKPRLVYIVTKASWGGAQRYVYDLACVMQDQYEVSVICGRNGFDTNPVFTDALKKVGISCYQINSMQRNISPWKELCTTWSLWRLLRKIDPEVVHLNSPKAAGLGGLIAWMQRVPKRVYTLHGMASSEDRPVWQKVIIDITTRITMLFCNKVIVPVQHEYDLAARWREVRGKLQLIHTGIPCKTILEKESALAALQARIPKGLAERICSPDWTTVLGVGEINANKSWETVIVALEELQDKGKQVLFVHMGTGVDQMQLQERIDCSSARDRVILLGFVEQSYQYMSIADVFVLPSRKELLGYVLLEAAQVPLPVVASQTGGIPEIIVDRQTGVLFPAGDTKMLAHAIEQFIDKPNIATEYASNLQQHYCQEFSFEQMINKTQEVYED